MLLVTTVVFFLPSIAMGTVSPVVAKLAVERVRKSDLTGRAIGQVYAWGMVGSILGTFLAGFVLIDLLGTKGLLLILGTSLAMAATMLGSVWHAAWAGIPLGLCVLAFVPGRLVREAGDQPGASARRRGTPTPPRTRSPGSTRATTTSSRSSNEPDADGQKRTLVLDNLIHGYFILGHPERLDYDYEHIYALVSQTRGAGEGQGRRKDAGRAKATTPLARPCSWAAVPTPSSATCSTPTPARPVDVAEIDPAVTNANHMALGLPLRHADQDDLGRRPPVRREAAGQEAVRPDLRRRLQRLLGPLAPDDPRVQREARQHAQPRRAST